MHPEAGGGRRAHLFHHPHPDIRFSVYAVAALIALFFGGSRNTEKGVLGQATQHGWRLWSHRQHALKQEAAPFPVADLPHTRHAGMRGQINCGWVRHQEDDPFLGQARVGVLPMRLHQRCKGHVWLIEQSVHRFEGFPGVVLLRQRSCRIAGYCTGGLDRPPGAPSIPQLCRSEGLLGPLVCLQHLRCFH